MTRLGRIAVLLMVVIAPRILSGQERGAIVLGESVAGLDVTARVLLIGAHPDDEDTQLLTWLARGRHVETAYLSLTRGDGGQNLIGNELGERLGMIRTEELLAARRLDGGRQYFTRAYDFGFSKTAEETYRHWPRDELLKDVVSVVRAFRPHIIVAVFSGTPADGHGHHQVSGMMARQVFDAAADSTRVDAFGLPAWTPLKFYRAQRGNAVGATVGFNVGELSTLRGQTYAEIASDSRSQHSSQGFGSLQRRGTSMEYVRLEASRVSAAGKRETSPFEDIATDWSRFRGRDAAVDSLPAAIAAVRRVQSLTAPDAMVEPLARVLRLMDSESVSPSVCGPLAERCRGADGDLAVSLETAQKRARAALLAASGVLIEVTAPRDVVTSADTIQATVAVYNQGRSPVNVYTGGGGLRVPLESLPDSSRWAVPPDSVARITIPVSVEPAGGPWWMAEGRETFDFFKARTRELAMGEDRVFDTGVTVVLQISGMPIFVDAGPIIYRFADPARGEIRRPVAAVPLISVVLDNEVEYARAGVAFDRTYNVRLRNSGTLPRGVSVRLTLPAGLRADSGVRQVAMQPASESVVAFRVRGTLPAGRHELRAIASSGGVEYATGFVPIDYEHIRPLRYQRAATMQLEAVPATLPKRTTIAYIRGVGDNVAPMLSQLGLSVTVLAPDEVPRADLSKYGAVIVGPRAFDATPALAAQAGKFQAFARAGGTVVVQYGQYEMQAPGLLPFPITLGRPASRVTEEVAPVTFPSRSAPMLTTPNRITERDFDGWVQERSIYMPSTADSRWERVLSLNDPNEPANQHSVLVAPLGKGAYVYTSLALFRQLPAGVPGAARLMLNLIGADGSRTRPVLPQP